MKITRQQLIRVLVPGFGVTVLGITAYSVTAAGSRHSNTIIRTHTNAAPTDSSKPAAQITVNGMPVPLDINGRAAVTTENGASVNVSAPVSQPDSSPQQSTQAAPTTSITITSGDGQTTTTQSQDETTRVRIRGNSSTSTSTYSNTSVYSNGDGLVQIEQSN